jgi:predicted GH43/DUF377 family glycosyl hydrolase
VPQPPAEFPYVLHRVGTVMSPLHGDPLEAEGVLNPGSARGRNGELYLLPRLVAAGNVSRVGLARVIVTDGTPTDVERRGVVLAPDRSWERGDDHSGVEDPRVTWIDALGVYVMTYVAFGPLGPLSPPRSTCRPGIGSVRCTTRTTTRSVKTSTCDRTRTRPSSPSR